jgi:hypothetical protein
VAVKKRFFKAIVKWLVDNGLWSFFCWLWDRKGWVVTAAYGIGFVLGAVLAYIRGLSPLQFAALCVALGFLVSVIIFSTLLALTHRFVKRSFSPTGAVPGPVQDNPSQGAPSLPPGAFLLPYAAGARLRILFSGDNQVPTEVSADNTWGYYALATDAYFLDGPAQISGQGWAIFVMFNLPVRPSNINFHPATSCNPRPVIELKTIRERYAVVTIYNPVGVVPPGVVDMDFRPIVTP